MNYIPDEIFFCGTAVEITPIRSIDKRNLQWKERRNDNSHSNKISRCLRGKSESYQDWLTRV